MGADQVSFFIRVAEREKTDCWAIIRREVANYIAGIFDHLTPEKSYYNNLKLTLQDDKAVNYLQIKINTQIES